MREKMPCNKTAQNDIGGLRVLLGVFWDDVVGVMVGVFLYWNVALGVLCWLWFWIWDQISLPQLLVCWQKIKKQQACQRFEEEKADCWTLWIMCSYSAHYSKHFVLRAKRRWIFEKVSKRGSVIHLFQIYTANFHLYWGCIWLPNGAKIHKHQRLPNNRGEIGSEAVWRWQNLPEPFLWGSADGGDEAAC